MSMVETAPSKIQVRNLNFYYGKFHALKNINLDIAKNQVTAFIGPSGCGKSTLLRTFNKMFELYPEQRAEGEILLDGDNILTNSQDIALLRAAGQEITATARGYVIPAQNGLLRRIACIHSAEETRDELDAMVDCGCTVVDVIVDHPVYGQLSAPLHLRSRLDVEQFMARMEGAAPLSQLTDGIHLHSLSCPDEASYEHLKARLRELGFLAE